MTRAGNDPGCSTIDGMGWERRGLHYYYYQKVRQGGTVTSRYWGRGELAAAVAGMATIDARDRAERRDREAAALDRAEAATAAAAAAMAEIEALADAAVEAELAAQGLHIHRGQWRRRRGA